VHKIFLEDNGTKIFLDFSQSFTFGSEYFTSWLKARDLNGLGDYFEFNLLPRIRGLHSREMLAFTSATRTVSTLPLLLSTKRAGINLKKP